MCLYTVFLHEVLNSSTEIAEYWLSSVQQYQTLLCPFQERVPSTQFFIAILLFHKVKLLCFLKQIKLHFRLCFRRDLAHITFKEFGRSSVTLLQGHAMPFNRVQHNPQLGPIITDKELSSCRIKTNMSILMMSFPTEFVTNVPQCCVHFSVRACSNFCVVQML